MKNPEQAKLVRTSKFLSWVLRHRPDAMGLKLDGEGWVRIDLLLMAAYKDGREISKDHLLEVVRTDDKQRYQLSEDGTKIRAVQGHSIETNERTFLQPTPPAYLYHGTAVRFLEAIFAEGLKPMTRQFVHLSADLETAKKVGQRHGQVAVLVIATQELQDRHVDLYQAENGVWLAKSVPTEVLRRGYCEGELDPQLLQTTPFFLPGVDSST